MTNDPGVQAYNEIPLPSSDVLSVSARIITSKQLEELRRKRIGGLAWKSDDSQSD